MVCSTCGYSRTFHVAVNISFDQRGAVLPSRLGRGALICRRCGGTRVVISPQQRVALVQWLIRAVFGAGASQSSLFS